MLVQNCACFHVVFGYVESAGRMSDKRIFHHNGCHHTSVSSSSTAWRQYNRLLLSARALSCCQRWNRSPPTTLL